MVALAYRVVSFLRLEAFENDYAGELSIKYACSPAVQSCVMYRNVVGFVLVLWR